jgi:hypothetical protein
VSEWVMIVPFDDIEARLAQGWVPLRMASEYSILMRWEGEGEPA